MAQLVSGCKQFAVFLGETWVPCDFAVRCYSPVN